jgi:hypothetical protein
VPSSPATRAPADPDELAGQAAGDAARAAEAAAQAVANAAETEEFAHAATTNHAGRNAATAGG